MEKNQYTEEQIVAIARAAHEVNRTWCELNNDFTQTAWVDAPQWQRDSAILGVKHLIANPDAEIDSSHISWMNQKIADGWVYGPEKDPVKKTHPCMIPFVELPFPQQWKDNLFTLTFDNFDYGLLIAKS